MALKLTLREAQRTDDAGPLDRGPVGRWVVDGLPNGEQAEIAEFSGTWRILMARAAVLESDPREFATPDEAFAALVADYADPEW